MSREGEVVQVLVLFEQNNVLDYGLALWAALHEVEHFYRPAAPNLSYRRSFVSPTSLEPGFLAKIARNVAQIFVNAQAIGAVDLPEPRSVRQISQQLRAEETAVIDQNRLVAAVRDVTDEVSDAPMLVVTDRAIVPPADWRYVIWDAAGSTWSESVSPPAVVLSVAPLDPRYWRESETDRIATIKSRARAAALSITGSMLGIGRCADRACFMFNPVSSVLTLDGMCRFGRDHDHPELEGRRFDARVSDPGAISPVIVAEPPP